MTTAPSQLEALIKAIQASDVDTANTLLLQGLNPNEEDKHGVPPLIYATRKDDVAMVELLLDHRADINQAYSAGVTPLMGAAERSIAVLPVLIARGARLDVKDDVGNTALDWAKNFSRRSIREEATRLLLEAQEKQKQLLAAISKGDISRAKKLLEQGADPNEKDANNKTALHLAAKNEDALDLVKLLVEKGADLETATIDSGHTPVRHALHAHNIPALLFLIEKGADLEKKDKYGNTALKWADLAGSGFREVKEILEKVPLQRAEKKKLADQHDTAAARQKALTKINARLKTGPR